MLPFILIILLLVSLYLISKYIKDKSQFTQNSFPVTDQTTTQMPQFKPPKDCVVTEDEIRFHAYLIASDDGFKKDPNVYWKEAEKSLKGI
jgi:hypothetical protein